MVQSLKVILWGEEIGRLAWDYTVTFKKAE